MRTETNPRLLHAAHHALKYQDPTYKARVDAEARKRGIEQGSAVTRSRHDKRSLNP